MFIKLFNKISAKISQLRHKFAIWRYTRSLWRSIKTPHKSDTTILDFMRETYAGHVDGSFSDISTVCIEKWNRLGGDAKESRNIVFSHISDEELKHNGVIIVPLDYVHRKVPEENVQAVKELAAKIDAMVQHTEYKIPSSPDKKQNKPLDDCGLNPSEPFYVKPDYPRKKDGKYFVHQASSVQENT